MVVLSCLALIPQYVGDLKRTQRQRKRTSKVFLIASKRGTAVTC